VLKKLLLAVIALSFTIAPALAQNSPPPHFQGGPKSNVPPHMGDLPRSKPATPTGQSGQQHFQGGPKEPHHAGNMPGAQQKAPKHSKKQKRRDHQH
jgi:hypothetical protein